MSVWRIALSSLIGFSLTPMALATPTLSVHDIIQQEAQRSGVPVALIQAVIHVESNHNPKAVSPKGAQGLMQLMPATAQRFGVRNAFDPAQNIRAGSTYLAWLYRRYQNWSLALAGYNAGEGAVDKYGGIPPYRETRRYVRKVLARYQAHNAQKSTNQLPFYAVTESVPTPYQPPSISPKVAAQRSPIFFDVGKGL